MGRSAGDADGVRTAIAAQAWEAVRRALGKWVSRTRVLDLPPDSMVGLSAVSDRDLLTGPAPARGVREQDCRPEARIFANLTPEAAAGGEGIDLAAVITIVSGDGALGGGDCPVHAMPVVPGIAEVFTPDTDSWKVAAAGVCGAPTRPAGGECRMLPVESPRAPRMGRLATVLPAFARPPKTPRLGGGPDGLPRPRRMVIRNGIGILSRIPLIRRSLDVDRLSPSAHPEERARLAAMGKTTADRVLVVGMFPAVPVAAVSRLALELDGSELRIWLKPEAVASGVTPKMMTLLIGRDRETGKTIQTVL